MKWVVLSVAALAIVGAVWAVVASRRPRGVLTTYAADVRAVPAGILSVGAGAAVDARGRMILCGDMGPNRGPAVTLTAVDPLPTLAASTLRPSGVAPTGVVIPSAAVVTETDTLYVFGGWRADGLSPDDGLTSVDLSAPARAWTAVPRSQPWPPGRNGASMAYDRGGHRLILLLGDSALDARGMFYPLADVWQFDLRTRRWSRLSPAGPGPDARWHAMAVVVEATRRLYVIGGAGVGAADRSLYVLDLAADAWRKIPPRGAEWPPSLQGATLTHDPRAGALLLAGGLRNEQPGPGTSADLWVFDVTAERWQRINGGETVRRRDHCAFYDAAAGVHVLIGGKVTPEARNFYASGPPVAHAAVVRLTPSTDGARK